MKAQFLISPSAPGFDRLPRSVKLAVRKATIIERPADTADTSRTSLDLDSGAPYIDDSAYYGMNNVDQDFDLDGSAEFGDSDGSDELQGLTIIEPGHGNIRRWLKGYDIL